MALNGRSTYLIDGILAGGSTLTVTLDWMPARTVGATFATAANVGQANLDLIVRDSLAGNLISESISD